MRRTRGRGAVRRVVWFAAPLVVAGAGLLACAQTAPSIATGRCLMCHIDLYEQLRGGKHGPDGANLGCETCHGESLGHVRDEHDVVKPDRMFSSADPAGVAAITDLCGVCHAPEADEYRAAVAALTQHEPPLPSCTGCHGSHRLVRDRLAHAQPTPAAP